MGGFYMNENEKKILNQLETELSNAVVRLCAVQISGPGVVALARAMEGAGRALECCQALKDAAKKESGTV